MSDVLPVTLYSDVVTQLPPLGLQQVDPPCLGVVHLVTDPGVELLRVGLSRLVELEGNLGVNTETEVVVHDVQRRPLHNNQASHPPTTTNLSTPRPLDG